MLLSLILLSSSDSFAQWFRPYDPPPVQKVESPYKGYTFNYPADNYSIDNNFYGNNNRYVFEDAYGRMWFVGSNTGFAAFDGSRVYQYNSRIGFQNRMKYVTCDSKGRVYVGGNGTGIQALVYPLVQEWYVQSPFLFPDSSTYDIGDPHISAMSMDSKDNLWVGTSFNGVTRISRDTVVIYGASNDKLPFDFEENERAIARNLIIDGEDRVWFVMKKQICYIENEKVYIYDHEFPFKGEPKLALAGQNYILVVYPGKASYKVTKDKVEDFPFVFGTRFHSAQTNSKGELFAKESTQLYKIVNGEKQIILDSKAKFNLNKFFIDSKDRIWVTTNNRGVFVFNDLSIRTLENYRIHHNKGLLTTIQNDSAIYLARPDSGKTIKISKIIDKEGKNKIYVDLFLDTIAVKGPGITKAYVIQTGELIEHPNKFYHKYEAFYPCETGILGYSENGEAGFYNGKSSMHITTDDMKGSHNFIKSTNEAVFILKRVDSDGPTRDANGYIYKYTDHAELLMGPIGGDTCNITGCHYINDTTFILTTWGNYYLKVTPNSAEYFRGDAQLNILRHIIKDRQGNSWIVDLEGGLQYIDNKTAGDVGVKFEFGLPGATVKEIGTSEENFDVFISTDAGIAWLKCIDPEMEVYNADDFLRKYEFEVFDRDDGLVGSEFGHTQMLKGGILVTYATTGHTAPQFIYTKELEDNGPDHLLIEKITIEPIDDESYLEFMWYPGMLYKTPKEISFIYTDNLLVDLSSIYYEDHFKQSYAFKIDNNDWSEPIGNPHFRFGGLTSGKHTIHFKAIAHNGVESEPISLRVSIIGPITEKAWFWILIITGFGLFFYGFFRWRTILVRKRAKALEQTVAERTAEINLQKIEIETQHEEIRDSINYAKRLQDAILPDPARIDKVLSDYFVYYKPKDVVSGDFYWFQTIKDPSNNEKEISFIAAADCTGHGVPGAMVSVVCSNALNRSIKEFKITKPSEILDKTRELVIETFAQSTFDVKDGMDIALCALYEEKVIFAGANNPLWIVRDNAFISEEQASQKSTIKGELKSLFEIKGNKQPVGIHEHAVPFNEKVVETKPGDVFYLFTDGFPDQFGGERNNTTKPGGKKLKYKPFKQLLLSLTESKLKGQEVELDQKFEAWKGSFEQVDDVCVIGFKLS